MLRRQDKLFIALNRNATNATDFFQIPTGRVVELGAQVTVPSRAALDCCHAPRRRHRRPQGPAKHELDAFKIVRIGVFGSTARDMAGPDSDIDILVEFEGAPSHFRLPNPRRRLRRALATSSRQGWFTRCCATASMRKPSMHEPDWRIFVFDILRAIANIEAFAQAMTRPRLPPTRCACMRSSSTFHRRGSAEAVDAVRPDLTAGLPVQQHGPCATG